MTIYFGLELDDLVYKGQEETKGGISYLGPKGLLYMLESHLGLTGHPTNNQYLRIEQYRQIIQNYLETYGEAFFESSFEADQFATAAALLDRRDELKIAGWDFSIDENSPQRIQVIAMIEKMLIEEAKEKPSLLDHGFADRFIDVLTNLEKRKHPIKELYLNEPFELLPTHFQQLFKQLEKKDVQIHLLEQPKTVGNNDLSKFKQAILSPSSDKQNLEGDGSLLILEARRETDAAAYLAKLFAKNQQWKPLCLIPDMNRALDNAFIQEGLPSMGILSASQARPSLQILKLITTFLWKPIDPFKILEFVSLSVKPLDDNLAKRIAAQMAHSPGLYSDSWNRTIARYFDELDDRAAADSRIDKGKIRFQYKMWFDRRKYDISKAVPKDEVIEIFTYLAQWAFDEFEVGGSKNTSLNVLSAQAKRITDLLEVLPDSKNFLSHLELERIVRTIYEPSPVTFREREKESLQYVYQPSAILESADEVVWWNFIDNQATQSFSNWYQKELDYLADLKISLQQPHQKNQITIWQRKRPILQAQKRLVLILPDSVDGKEVQPHPLHGDLQAAFSNHESIIFDITSEKGRPNFESHFQMPGSTELEPTKLGAPPPFVKVDAPDLDFREYETFTSLDALFYYPYQWVFKYKINLYKSSILSILPDSTLMGNLAHRFFELLFKEDIHDWNQQQIWDWVDQEKGKLFAREGAVLLMYGREPERQSFINKIKYAAWSLVSLIQNNGWKVIGSEKDLEGTFEGKEIRAKADLVLQRGEELAVVDLKWRGLNRRKSIIKNEEDLQLVTYSRLLTDDDTWAHTAYFIIEEGKMIARNNLAFEEATAVAPDADYKEVNNRIWDKMLKTYRWRVEQLKKGEVEIRTEHTLLDLEDAYHGKLIELLEMKNENSYFDDYKTLISLIE